MEITRNPLTTNSKNDPGKKAISLALNGEWAEAAELNRTILQKSPDDVEAMNRLGKSLMELGKYSEAKAVLARVVQLAPYNSIAKKNLGRLDQLEAAPNPAQKTRKSGGVPQLFIEESGKSGITVLQKAATGPIVASIGPGEPLTLNVDKNAIVVSVREDEYLGQVEPKLANRLIRLMNGGNRYQAAVIRVKEQGITIIIREIYRHPSLHDVCPFPSKGRGDNRVYLGESLMRYIEDSELDEDEEAVVVIDRDVNGEEWEE